MNLTEPRELKDIVGKLDAKTPIGSALRTAEWGRLPQGLRDRAVFSASVESVRWVQRIKDGVREIATRAQATNERGETYFSTDRSKLVEQLRRLGQQEGIAHPEGTREKGKGIRENDVTDPLSLRRLKLIVDTQMEMAYGHGDFLAANDPAVLDVWPCWELVRISPRAVPRDWRRRWLEAGGTLHDGRMIARKDSGIWTAINRFGNPYPPFDFGSGMGVEEVMRDEAEALGILTPDEKVESQVEPFNAKLEASVRGLGEAERRQIKRLLGDRVEIEGDAVRWRENGAPPPVAPAAVPPPPAPALPPPQQQAAVPPVPPPPPPDDPADYPLTGSARAIQEFKDMVPGATLKEMHALANGVKGETVVAARQMGRLKLYIHDNGVVEYAERTLAVDASGRPYIHNDFFILKSPGGGEGTRRFIAQVKAAQKLGFAYLETLAARQAGTYNGYITWPKLGYNALVADLTPGKQAEMRAHFGRDFRTMHDLFDHPGGPDWWELNGETFACTFDLRPGSKHLKMLEDYARRKGIPF